MRGLIGPQPRGSLTELLDLREVGEDRFHAELVFPDAYPLYGGQVAAQALVAAGRTVAQDRPPHSLHVYFLRAGRSHERTDFVVSRERDGGSFSSRRVVASQRGRVIAHMAASFHRPESGVDEQRRRTPVTAPPEAAAPFELPRLFSTDARLPPQPYAELRWPVRFWTRPTENLDGDTVLQAAALTYMSDISTGLAPLRSDVVGSSSLDHALWFHRPIPPLGWVLSDLEPHNASGGRGWYTGSLFHEDGTLLASLAQEALFR